jgi:bleomycin hydrolase
MSVNKKDEMPAKLDASYVEELSKGFDNNPANRVRQNVLAETKVSKVALNHSAAIFRDHSFSNVLDDWSVTNQKSSGRCWLFAGLNLLRVGAMKKMKLKNFEFSQNFIMFWDKFEKANHFLEAIIETAELPIEDRTVQFLIGSPMNDAGQWDMFINVVKKYGVVPKAVMPETESSSDTGGLNNTLVSKLRLGAKQIRDAYEKKAAETILRNMKREILKISYDILRIHLGNPPESFKWQWIDDDKQFHRETYASPKQFAETYITVPIDEYISLVNDPRSANPIGRTFTVQYLGNVVAGGTVKYLNVDIELIKEIAMKTIVGGEPVWFGCDAGKMFHRDKSILDANLYDYEGFYGTELELESKEDRLLYASTSMNHAMLFTGVDIEDGKPVQWRIENSWGDKGEAKGFFLMKDSWFNHHMFEIAARKSSLPDDLQKAFEEEPIVLPPWDPMGSLA